MGKIMKIAICLALALVAVTTLHADELQDLSSADVAPSVESKVSEPKAANLGEGTGNFAGALMTSGSFTIMAATGSVEEELGEGEGTGNFAGALMTSVVHHDGCDRQCVESHDPTGSREAPLVCDI